jgi:hypothetical protein
VQAVSGKKNASFTVARTYADGEEPDLLTRDTFSFSIYIVTFSPRAPAEREPYTVALTLRSGGAAYTAEAEIDHGKWYTLSFPIGEWDLRGSVNGYEITVTDHGDGLDGFRIGAVEVSGDADVSRAEAFTSLSLAAEGGSAVFADGAYRLDAGSDGVLSVSANAIRDSYAAVGKDGVYALRVVLENALSGGFVSLSVSESAAEVGAFLIASSCPLYAGENTYLLPFDGATALRAFRLTFRGLYADGGDAVVRRAVTLERFPDRTEAYAGKLTECAFTDGMQTLSIEGTIPSDTVAQYIRGRIEVYEIPLWVEDPSEIYEAEPLASIKISTRFSMQIDLSARTYAAPASRYAVVIASDGEKIPLAAPRFPDQKAQARARTLSVVGLYGADTAGIFTANASSVIVDVYIDRLLGGEAGAGRLIVRGRRYFYLDQSYLNALDGEIRFCLSADAEVYLRLLCASDMSAEGYTYPSETPARFYAVNVYTEEGANMLCAVTEFLSSRYPGICGLIAGARMDRFAYNGADFSDAEAYAALCADTMRLIYNAAAAAVPDVYVLAPLGHSESDSLYTASGADGTLDPVMLAVLLSRHMDRSGRIPWGLLYLSDVVEYAFGHAQNIVSQMKTIGCSTPTEYLLLWEPDTDYVPDLLLEYEQRCVQAQAAGARVLFLSVTGIGDTQALYRGLKYVLNDAASNRRLEEFEARVLGGDPGFAGRYVWSDFSRAYSTLGWIAGSGCTRLGTQTGDRIRGDRTLCAVFCAEDGDVFTPVTGNILCVTGVTDDFRAAPCLVYSLRLTAELETTQNASLTFIFGSGDTRAEYTVTAPVGEPLSILCDLTDFSGADTVDFSAIAVESDSAISLELSGIACCSREQDDEALALAYRYRQSGADDGTGGGRRLTGKQTALAAAVVLASAVTVALLSKRREERTR